MAENKTKFRTVAWEMWKRRKEFMQMGYQCRGCFKYENMGDS